jgi:hypothetical protein
MNKKSLFILLLSMSSISSAYSIGENKNRVVPMPIIGGCTPGSLGPAYSTSICNSDGTYKDDVKHTIHHHVFHFLHFPMHSNRWGANPSRANPSRVSANR